SFAWSWRPPLPARWLLDPGSLGAQARFCYRQITIRISAIPMSKPEDWDGRIGRRITLRDLHILSQVVRRGSMAKAATELATSQSVVSDSVANLESALGVRLLDRTARGVEPTIYAAALLKRGHAAFDELRQGIKD